MAANDHDFDIRMAAFAFLDEQRQVHGDILPRTLLTRGFDYQGNRILLVGPQGIFKPAVMDLPLTITTAPPTTGRDQPYDDQVGRDGILLYRYRGRNPNHHDNVRLREVMRRRLPLIYLYGIVKGRYYPIYPVFITADNPASLTFAVTVDDPAFLEVHSEVGEADVEGRRKYVTTLVQQRLHQQGFRERVLSAYKQRCAICTLRHGELLDAAHILPDSHPKGQPIVPNGLSLCKLHHAAFDRNFLGVTPDYVIQLRQDIIEEDDGPMLVYGIQAFHEKHLFVPRSVDLKPDPDRLAERYEVFRASA